MSTAMFLILLLGYTILVAGITVAVTFEWLKTYRQMEMGNEA